MSRFYRVVRDIITNPDVAIPVVFILVFAVVMTGLITI